MDRKNPYIELKRSATDYIRKTRTRKSIEMWFYPKEKLTGNWRLDDLAQRCLAAEQLGYDVQLKVIDHGLQVLYVEKLPILPSWY